MGHANNAHFLQMGEGVHALMGYRCVSTHPHIYARIYTYIVPCLEQKNLFLEGGESVNQQFLLFLLEAKQTLARQILFHPLLRYCHFDQFDIFYHQFLLFYF